MGEQHQSSGEEAQEIEVVSRVWKEPVGCMVCS